MVDSAYRNQHKVKKSISKKDEAFIDCSREEQASPVVTQQQRDSIFLNKHKFGAFKSEDPQLYSLNYQEDDESERGESFLEQANQLEKERGMQRNSTTKTRP